MENSSNISYMGVCRVYYVLLVFLFFRGRVVCQNYDLYSVSSQEVILRENSSENIR